MKLKVGDKAPELNIPNQDGNIVNISDFAGKWLVLYFYPKDNTPGCTIQAVDFTNHLEDIEELDAEVVGVSKDSIESHCNFIAKKSLKIPLLSDSEAKVVDRYGVSQLKLMDGVESLGVVRSTFIIDPEGIIQAIWTNVSAKGHIEEVLEKLYDLTE